MMKKKILSVMLSAAMLLILAACGSTASSQSQAERLADNAEVLPESTITIFIAASLTKSFEDEGKLIDMYKERQPHVTIEVNSGSSGALEQQIEEGAPCDLFFSAGMKQMTQAEESGFVVEGSAVPLLENKVVLIKRVGDEACAVTGFQDMTKAASMALCADSVPAGQYARKIFDKLGIGDDIQNNAELIINECDKVTAALSAIAQGSNEIGIVYASDAANEPGVEVIAEATTAELEENPLYPVGLIDNHQADDTTKAAAADFLAFLQTQEALAVFSEYTFILHE